MFLVGKVTQKKGESRPLTQAELVDHFESCVYDCKDDSWMTSCGVEFYFDRDPETMGFKYCPNCAGKIKLKTKWLY